MAESINKKKRIARVGNTSNVQGILNLDNDAGTAERDNILYNILESMNNSHNAKTYQLLQENRSKEKVNFQTNNFEKSFVSKNNSRPISSKQLKKFVPEKNHPLMAKCQKSMKYLKKNMCIPKPRAHVGSVIPRSRQIPSHNTRSISSSTSNRKECSRNLKQDSRKSKCSQEQNTKQKKRKYSHYSDNSGYKNRHAETANKELKLTSDTDSDNEFEQFLEKHHPEKRPPSDNSTDSSIAHRKIKKCNIIKRKQINRRSICVTKVSEIACRNSDFEKSSESETECYVNKPRNVAEDNIENSLNVQSSSRRFQRIIEHINSDDSTSDTLVKESSTLNYDSSSSSEDNMCMKTDLSNKDNVNNDICLDHYERLDILPTVPCSVILVPPPLSELKNIPNFDTLKSNCKIPCFVKINRDLLLDQRAAALQTDNSLKTNLVSASSSYDDDCIIISEVSSNNFINESETTRQSVENNKKYQGESSTFTKTPVISSLANKNSSSSLKLQTETNSLVSNPKSIEIFCDDMEVSRTVESSTNSLFNNKKEVSSVESKITRHIDRNVNSAEYEEKSITYLNRMPQRTSDLPENRTDVSLNSDRATFSTEKETFNVQILSVKSLNESNIIVVSDGEEKVSETVPIMNVPKESSADDSDIEIICLDTSIADKKTVNENVRDGLSNDVSNKAENGLQKNLHKSSTQPVILDEDCIILDDFSGSKDNAKKLGDMSLSPGANAKLVGTINNETNLNKNEKIGNVLNSSDNLILKILDTIDFNCIKKVLNETATNDTQKIKAGDILPNSENLQGNDIQFTARITDSNQEKLKLNGNDIRPSQELTPVNVNITPPSSEVHIKISNINTSSVNTHEKHTKLISKSSISPKIKNDPDKVHGPIKLSNPRLNRNCEKSSSVLCSSTSHYETKLPENKISNLQTRKNQQLLSVDSQMEIFENQSYELDIIAAKSIQNLDEKNDSILPLLELYRAECNKFKEIKCTEQNVTAGLKLLQEKQMKKLIFISSSIKNLLKNDECLHKVNNEFGNNQKKHKSFITSCPIKKDESLNETKKPLENVSWPLGSNSPIIQRDDRLNIFHPSIIERTSEVMKVESIGPSSSQEVYNQLINSVCAECGKPAFAACSGCAKVYYCSEKCGMKNWDNGHCTTCRR